MAKKKRKDGAQKRSRIQDDTGADDARPHVSLRNFEVDIDSQKRYKAGQLLLPNSTASVLGETDSVKASHSNS